MAMGFRGHAVVSRITYNIGEIDRLLHGEVTRKTLVPYRTVPHRTVLDIETCVVLFARKLHPTRTCYGALHTHTQRRRSIR